jgi:glycosyltransferase involved in cell wall biosynthesis
MQMRLTDDLDELSRRSVTIVQPVVPNYRIGLFERLREQFGSGFVVYASKQEMGILTEHAAQLSWERRLGPIRPLLFGLHWQHGIFNIPIRKGDVVIVSGAPRCLSNLLLLLKARMKGARTIWWGHYWSSTSVRWRAAARLMLMTLSDGVLFYTEREIEEFLARVGSGAGRSRVFALNNGIETAEIVALRSRFDAATRPRDLLFLGRLTDKAELGALLEALAMPCCQGISLDVIGAGDLQAEHALKERARELGLQERVVWQGATTDERKIAAIANQCKLFVYPGAVGLSLVHALSYGLPAIVHDDRWTHMPEIAALTPGANGLVFKRGDPASLAHVIAEALADPVRLNVLSMEAVETTRRSFNAEDMAERFGDAILAMGWSFNGDLAEAQTSSRQRIR